MWLVETALASSALSHAPQTTIEEEQNENRKIQTKQGKHADDKRHPTWPVGARDGAAVPKDADWPASAVDGTRFIRTFQ